MNDFDFIELLKGFVPAMILSAFGCFISIIKGAKNIVVRYLIGDIMAAMLMGLILHALLNEYIEASTNIWAVTISLGGLWSRDLLEIVRVKVLAKVSKRLDDV